MSNKLKFRNLANSPIFTIMNQFRVGFELETQRIEGLTYNDIDRPQRTRLNRERYNAAVESHVESIMLTRDKSLEAMRRVFRYHRAAKDAGYPVWEAFKKWCALDFPDVDQGLKTIKEMLHSNRITTERRFGLQLLVDKGYLDAEGIVTCKSLVRAMVVNQGYVYESDYHEPTGEGPYIPTHWDDRLSMCRDGTVQGPEIKPVRPVSVSEFVELTNILFKNDMVINEGCSFHIHLSVKGMSHTYGKAFQANVYQYLLDNLNEVPESVRDRWEGDRSYFRTELSDQKYTFVHFHPSFKTWEFRCFGNVKNASDARKCLMLAIKAMRHAYGVKVGDKKMLVPMQEFTFQLASNAANNLKNITEITQAKAFRTAVRLRGEEASGQ